MSSVAVVVLDTLRKDAFDEQFDWLPGTHFERAYSTSNWTVPAHASLFTGLYPTEAGVHARRLFLDCDRPVLAERLREAGYTTRAYSANANVTGHFEFDRGFTDFRTPEQFQAVGDDSLFDWRRFTRECPHTGLRKHLAGIRACVTADCDTLPSLVQGARRAMRDDDATAVEYGGTIEATRKVADMTFGDREFLFLNLMEAHEPYRVPEDYRSVPEPDMTEAVGSLSYGSPNGEDVVRAYEDCARYLSDAYRDLFERLRSSFDYVITLSDHGELLGEHDGWGHEYGVYPELAHVPLVVTGPDDDGVDRRGATVGLVDVHRTVLSIAGVDAREDARGRDLRSIPSDSGDDGNDGNDGDDRSDDRLVEYTGLSPWSKQRLETEETIDPAAVDRHDGYRAGVATPVGYFYTTLDHEVAAGPDAEGDPESGRRRLEALLETVDRRVADDRTEVPDAVEDRLESLGYA